MTTADGEATGSTGTTITLLADYLLAHLGYFSLLAILEEFTAVAAHASAYVVGLVLFGYNAAVGVGCLLVARWLPALTYRTAMSLCLLLAALGLGALPLTHSVLVITGLLLVAGFGFSTHGLLAMSLITQTRTEDAARNRIFSLLQIVVNVAASVGPALAIALFGLPSKLPLFATIAVCYLLAATILLSRLPGGVRPTRPPRERTGSWRVRALAKPALLGTMGLTVLGAVLYAQLFSAFAVVVVRDLTGILHTWIFTINALLIVVLQTPVSALIGRFLDRGRSPGLFLGIGVLMFAGAFVLFGSPLPTDVAAVTGIVVFSFAEMVFTPLVSTAFARQGSGSAIGVFTLRQMCTTAGMMLGSFFGGGLFLAAAGAGHADVYWDGLAIGAVVLIALAAVLGARTHARRADAPATGRPAQRQD